MKGKLSPQIKSHPIKKVVYPGRTGPIPGTAFPIIPGYIWFDGHKAFEKYAIERNLFDRLYNSCEFPDPRESTPTCGRRLFPLTKRGRMRARFKRSMDIKINAVIIGMSFVMAVAFLTGIGLLKW